MMMPDAPSSPAAASPALTPALASSSSPSRRGFLGQLAWLFVVAGCHSSADGAAAAAPEIGPLFPPANLAARIADVAAGKIVVLYVGPDVLFAKGHIPGARQIAEASSEEGKHALDLALASAAADAEVVVYCGCCPVKSCPNVRPASAALRARGRANTWVLDLPTRFATDWTDKGYPVERG
jgi:thiosulfate/3-mercaptopyruvate sulfurtransferase